MLCYSEGLHGHAGTLLSQVVDSTNDELHFLQSQGIVRKE